MQFVNSCVTPVYQTSYSCVAEELLMCYRTECMMIYLYQTQETPIFDVVLCIAIMSAAPRHPGGPLTRYHEFDHLPAAPPNHAILKLVGAVRGLMRHADCEVRRQVE